MLNMKVLIINGSPDHRGCIGCRKCSLQLIHLELRVAPEDMGKVIGDRKSVV